MQQWLAHNAGKQGPQTRLHAMHPALTSCRGHRIQCLPAIARTLI